MAESLATRTVEGASGITIPLPFHLDSVTGYYYPLANLVPTELGGCLVSSLISAATTNATVVKTSAGQLYGFDLFSLDQTPVYLKFYDLAVAPTVGTSTIKLRFGAPAVATANALQKTGSMFTMGIAFGTGIAFALTTGILDADATAVAASEILVNVYYK